MDLLYPDAKKTSERIVNYMGGFEHLNLGSNELEKQAISYFIFKKCGESDDQSGTTKILCAGGYYLQKNLDKQEKLESFFNNVIKPLLLYLKENVEDCNFILTILKKYKYRTEWFTNRQGELLDIYNKETQKGEKNLTYDLYEYLYDRGVEFTMEPTSPVGEPDLIIKRQKEEDCLVAESKVFKGSNKGKMIEGFNQVYQYTLAYNEPFSYLIIYNVSEKDLIFSTSKTIEIFNSVSVSNKTIYIFVIDISDRPSAAKQGKINRCEITEEELLEEIKKE